MSTKYVLYVDMNWETKSMAFTIIGTLLVGAVILGIITANANPCSGCHHDNRLNRLCEECTDYKTSLRHDYVQYCNSHNRFKKKGEDKQC